MSVLAKTSRFAHTSDPLDALPDPSPTPAAPFSFSWFYSCSASEVRPRLAGQPAYIHSAPTGLLKKQTGCRGSGGDHMLLGVSALNFLFLLWLLWRGKSCVTTKKVGCRVKNLAGM